MSKIKTLPGAAFAQNGFKEISGATLKGDFYAIVPHGGSATFSAVAVEGDALSSDTVSEGVPVYGRFTEITVSSGKVLAYSAVRLT